MKLLKTGAIVAPLLAIGAIVAVQATNPDRSAQSASPMQPGDGWGGMMGGWHGMMGPWPSGPGWPGHGPMPRHHVAMMWGVPAPYKSMMNPMPRTDATLDKGAAVYAENCAACHGEEGLGDGEAGRDLSPPPGNLAWLADMPMSQWDAFMYWTIAEGGAQLGTAMPAFKDSLSKDEIWAVTAYIQAHLPHKAE